MEQVSIEQSRPLQTLRRHCGPVLLKALEDPATIEIMLNPDGRLWQERLGESRMWEIGKLDFSWAEAICQDVAFCLGKVITPRKPQLDGEFPLDGSRFSGAIPPIVAAPTFAIRKHARRIFSLDKYVEQGVMTELQRDVLTQSIANHKNILVAGGTSSGKTTLVNALIAKMVDLFPDERVIIIEDTGEIQCAAANVVFMHSTDFVSITKLLKQSLRLRPNRICVGEVRDRAALDLLDAWNTGHEGGISTLHANSAFQGLSRLRGLVSRNAYAPQNIEEVIGEAVHRIAFVERRPEGRKVREILSVNGYSPRTGEYGVELLA